MSFLFERAYYRLVYPVAHRPTFAVDARVFPVVDLSEQGARLLVTEVDQVGSGDVLKGVVNLPTGETLEIEGQVVRVESPHACLLLKRGVPFAIMMEQQRFLQRRVVMWR